MTEPDAPRNAAGGANKIGRSGPLNTGQVLLEEAVEIHGSEKVEGLLGTPRFTAIRSGAPVDSATTSALYQALNSLGSAALCLSGGGIRSAAFGLGVIQALARHGSGAKGASTADSSLLARFHYLSTVSGGGYVGSWLSAWIQRSGFDRVWSDLVGQRAKPEDEPPQIGWLRSYSNFLTPKLGVLSVDTWAALALVLRNLVLNWLVVLPALCGLLIVLKLYAGAVVGFSQYVPRSCESLLVWMVHLGMLLMIVSLVFVAFQRPTAGKSRATQKWVLLLDLLPPVLAGFIFTFALASPCAEQIVIHDSRLPWVPFPLVPGLIVLGIVMYALAWVPDGILRHHRGHHGRELFWDFVAALVAGAVFGVLIAAGVYLYVMKVPQSGWGYFDPKQTLLLILGVPWTLLARLLAGMVFVGLTSWEKGSDQDREWLARASGVFLLTVLGWPILMFLVFAASHLVDTLAAQLKAWLVAGGAGAVVALIGKSSATPATGPAKTGKQHLANIGLALAGPIFLIALVIAVSGLIDWILFRQPLLQSQTFYAQPVTSGLPSWPGGPQLLNSLLLVVLPVGLVASYFININRFSLHALYRNRLVRAFLGASNPTRKRDRNPFTGFAESDNLHMHELWPDSPVASTPARPAAGAAAGQPVPAPAGAERRPRRPLFHVINIALNLVSSKNLAWQERKAASFQVSPRHSGAAAVGYRRSYEYAHAQGPASDAEDAISNRGISIGTALAISGAAASPNMGYHSAPSLAILLTLFNVRLGWWLGNPGKAGANTYQYEGPTWALIPLLWEMFGQTTDDHPYVYLSDGGHFENLGLYEMVRRRCRFIVVSDAGCDKEFNFDDLGNATRKIFLDLGVSITFSGLTSLGFRQKENTKYDEGKPPFQAIGRIDYPEGAPGVILYIKPCFHANRIWDVGVRNYAMLHADFPHESTGDQFFSESQFESYRALGAEMMSSVLTQALKEPDLPPTASLDDIFGKLQGPGPGAP